MLLIGFLHCLCSVRCISARLNVSRMRALNEPKTAKFEKIGAEFCVFKSNASGLKFNFYEPDVDMPRLRGSTATSALVEISQRYIVGWEYQYTDS